MESIFSVDYGAITTIFFELWHHYLIFLLIFASNHLLWNLKTPNINLRGATNT